MFIYFVEQVWSNEITYHFWNDETDEIQHRYWDQWHYRNRGSAYPSTYMEEGVDYIEW